MASSQSFYEIDHDAEEVEDVQIIEDTQEGETEFVAVDFDGQSEESLKSGEESDNSEELDTRSFSDSASDYDDLFDLELQKMFADVPIARKTGVNFDVAIPVHANISKLADAEKSQNELPFMLLTKKGGKQQVYFGLCQIAK